MDEMIAKAIEELEERCEEKTSLLYSIGDKKIKKLKNVARRYNFAVKQFNFFIGGENGTGYLHQYRKIYELSVKQLMRMDKEEKGKLVDACMMGVNKLIEDQIGKEHYGFFGNYQTEKKYKAERMKKLFEKSDKENEEFLYITKEEEEKIKQILLDTIRDIFWKSLDTDIREEKFDELCQREKVKLIAEVKGVRPDIRLHFRIKQEIYAYFDTSLEKGVKEEDKILYENISPLYIDQIREINEEEYSLRETLKMSMFQHYFRLQELVPNEEWIDIEKKMKQFFQTMKDKIKGKYAVQEMQEVIYLLKDIQKRKESYEKKRGS